MWLSEIHSCLQDLHWQVITSEPYAILETTQSRLRLTIDCFNAFLKETNWFWTAKSGIQHWLILNTIWKKSICFEQSCLEIRICSFSMNSERKAMPLESLNLKIWICSIFNEFVKKSDASGQSEQSRLGLRLVPNSIQVLQTSIDSGHSRLSASELILFSMWF